MAPNKRKKSPSRVLEITTKKSQPNKKNTENVALMGSENKNTENVALMGSETRTKKHKILQKNKKKCKKINKQKQNFESKDVETWAL